MRSGRGRAECPRSGGDAPAPVPPRRTSASPRRGYGASQPPCSFRVVFVFCAIFARPRFSPRSPGAASQHPFCRVRYLIFRRHLRMKDVQSALERTGVKRAARFHVRFVRSAQDRAATCFLFLAVGSAAGLGDFVARAQDAVLVAPSLFPSGQHSALSSRVLGASALAFGPPGAGACLPHTVYVSAVKC